MRLRKCRPGALSSMQGLQVAGAVKTSGECIGERITTGEEVGSVHTASAMRSADQIKSTHCCSHSSEPVALCAQCWSGLRVYCKVPCGMAGGALRASVMVRRVEVSISDVISRGLDCLEARHWSKWHSSIRTSTLSITIESIPLAPSWRSLILTCLRTSLRSQGSPNTTHTGDGQTNP